MTTFPAVIKTSVFPSSSQSVYIRRNISCIVLDIELADSNVFKELRVVINGNVQGYSFGRPKKHQYKKQASISSKTFLLKF